MDNYKPRQRHQDQDADAAVGGAGEGRPRRHAVAALLKDDHVDRQQRRWIYDVQTSLSFPPRWIDSTLEMGLNLDSEVFEPGCVCWQLVLLPDESSSRSC